MDRIYWKVAVNSQSAFLFEFNDLGDFEFSQVGIQGVWGCLIRKTDVHPCFPTLIIE
jgi:hypothetical protein